MIAVYTLHMTEESLKKNCGFNSEEDMINSILLSSNLAKKNFGKVVIYCNEKALKYLEYFPGEVKQCLDEIKFPSLHWSYPKIVTYGMQTEPFLHIDFDAFLWSKLPDELLKKDFLFQQKEPIGETFPYYQTSIDLCFERGVLTKMLPRVPEYSHNAGIFGCFNPEYLPIMPYFKMVVDQFIKQCVKANRYDFFDCITFEQLLITEILKKIDTISVGTLLTDDGKPIFKSCKFTHLLSTWKNDSQNMLGVKFQLDRRFPNAKKK